MTGQVIHDDGRAIVAELAFGPRAMIVPHTNPNTTLFIVIGGGGWVQVGDERSRVNQGEAVVWPAGVEHGAYTEGSEMRAIVVELAGADDAAVQGVLEGRAERLAGVAVRGPAAGAAGGAAAAPTEESERPSGDAQSSAEKRPSRAEGELAERVLSPDEYDRSTGEPW